MLFAFRYLVSLLIVHNISSMKHIHRISRRQRQWHKQLMSDSDVEEMEKVILPKHTEYIGDERSEWDGYMV